MKDIKARIGREVDVLANDLFAANDYLFDNPELGYSEVKACAYLSKFLGERGFTVETGVGGLETAFKARPAGRRPSSPTVAFVAEYDALPEIGHGCGHNMIAMASIGGAIALARALDDAPDGIAVIGTPAEEGGGGKVFLAEAGVFDDIDAAVMFHPATYNLPGKDFLGRIKFKVEFFGKTAHAAASPEMGVNALDAMIAAFNGISALRQHIRDDARIHGVITHGGLAPNIIPDYTAGLFYVRGATRAYRDELFERVKNCFEGAALATGTTYKLEVDQPTIDPMWRVPALEQTFRDNVEALGVTIDEDDRSKGSSDMGNLSHHVPAIHPFLAIAESDIAGHSIQFAEATKSPRGRKTLVTAAQALAATAFDYLTSPDLRQQARSEFERAG